MLVPQTLPKKLLKEYGGGTVNHPGLSKIPAPAGGPGCDIINLRITIGGQKLGAGRFLIPDAGRGLTFCLPKFASAF